MEKANKKKSYEIVFILNKGLGRTYICIFVYSLSIAMLKRITIFASFSSLVHNIIYHSDIAHIVSIAFDAENRRNGRATSILLSLCFFYFSSFFLVVEDNLRQRIFARLTIDFLLLVFLFILCAFCSNFMLVIRLCTAKMEIKANRVSSKKCVHCSWLDKHLFLYFWYCVAMSLRTNQIRPKRITKFFRFVCD